MGNKGASDAFCRLVNCVGIVFLIIIFFCLAVVGVVVVVEKAQLPHLFQFNFAAIVTYKAQILYKFADYFEYCYWLCVVALLWGR